MAKILLFLALGLVAATMAIVVGVWWTNHSARNLAVKEQSVAGAATVVAGQAQTQVAAQQIVTAGQARDRVDLHIHEDNANAIAIAPGASDALNPAVVRTARLGLCRHPAYAADPGCAGLLQPDPPVLPGAGGAGSPY